MASTSTLEQKIERRTAARVRRLKREGGGTSATFLIGVSLAAVVAIAAVAVKSFQRLGTYKFRDAPEVLVIDGVSGKSAKIVNGEYHLRYREVNGHPTWAKKDRQGSLPSAYVLFSECGEWLVSGHPFGRGSKCDGYLFGTGCGNDREKSGPWDCSGVWRSWRRDGRVVSTVSVGDQKGVLLSLCSLYVSPSLGPGALSTCTPSEEAEVIAKVRDVDIAILWVNGSEPRWLQERAKTCEEFMWRRYPDALKRSGSTRICLQEKEAVEEAAALFERGECERGAGEEGMCGGAVDNKTGLTTRSSYCFRQFVETMCDSRVKSISDQDELRYLLRSIDTHMPWHQGRILVISPEKHFPRWLRPHGRLKLVAQEKLLKKAMQSPDFVSAADRGEPGFLPDSIFNDYPVQNALPFLPHASRLMMVFQDDLVLPRAVGACELFTRPPGVGMRLFGDPLTEATISDPYDRVFSAHQVHSSQFWDDHVFNTAQTDISGSATSSPYYEPQHTPFLLDTDILKEFWQRWPRQMSSDLDSPFRHPDIVDTVGLHNSEVVMRSREVRSRDQRTTSWRWQMWAKIWSPLKFSLFGNDWADLIARSRIVNVDDPGQELVHQVVINEGSRQHWERALKDIVRHGQKVPAILSIQDNLGSAASPEYLCHRQRWLTKLLPNASSWESATEAPHLCAGVD